MYEKSIRQDKKAITIEELSKIIDRDLVCLVCNHANSFLSLHQRDIDTINATCICGSENIFFLNAAELGTQGIKLRDGNLYVYLGVAKIAEEKRNTFHYNPTTQVKLHEVGFVAWCNFTKFDRLKNFV